MKKVLVITYYWPPSGGAGVQRILKFAKYLPEFGIQTYVVTVDENKAGYPFIDTTLNEDIPQSAVVARTNTAEPFEIYSRFLGKKSIPTGFSNESSPGLFRKFSRFIRGNFFIPDARRGWVKYAFREACKIIERENINIVITTSPPHSAQLAGLKLKKRFNIKWIADLRDPWTDIYYYDEFNHLSFARNLDLKYEREVLENADRIITVSSELKKLFIKKSPKLIERIEEIEEKILVIPNGYDEDDFKRNVNNFSDEFVITYTGTLAESYNPGIFFRALKKITGMFPEIKFRLRFIGNPAAAVIEKAKNISLSKYLELVPTVSHKDSVSYLLNSTIVFLVIPEIKNDKGILTGKLFEYLAARKPIICIGPVEGDAAAIIRECESGKTFNRNMESELTLYLEELVKKWESGQHLIDLENDNYKKYSRQSQARELSEIINSF